MTPRHRSKQNQALVGTNIKVHRKSGKDYFYYIMPDGTLEPLIHNDEAASIQAAIALNNALRPSGNIVDRILNRPPRQELKNPPLSHVIKEFECEWLEKQGFSIKYLAARRSKLRQYERHWPTTMIGDVDTFEAAQFLKPLTPEAARQHHSLLKQLYQYAASNGYETQRPMVDIERKKQQKRQRARHTWEGHIATYEASPPWLKIAIDAALKSLQRRSDLVGIDIDRDIDLKNRTIRILQHKTLNYDEPVYINIAMGQELYDCVLASRFSGINCPMLIHHKQRITRSASKNKPHPFAVTSDYLTRAYSKVRDEVGIYNHLDKAKRPGLHSLRALGIFAYSKAGYPDPYILALSGHADKKMKDIYFEGHEKKKPVTVNADLNFKDLDLSSVDWETELSPALLKIVNSGE